VTNEITVRSMNGEVQEAFLSKQAVELIKATWFKGASDAELQLGIAVADRYRLDPVKKQIYFVKRYDSAQKCQVMQAQVSIDGLRLLAERTGKYAGQTGPFWCGKDGVWQEVWTGDGPPFAAKVGVIRSDWKDVLWAVAKWSSYVATTREGNVTQMWQQFPDAMLAKCAESLALRRAFPSETGGVYTDAEMEQADVQVRSIEDAEVVREAPRRQPQQAPASAPAQPTQPTQPAAQPQQASAAQQQNPPCPRGKHCVGSGRIEQTRVEANGKVYDLTPDDIARATEKQFGFRLCYACGQAEKARRESKAEPAPVYAGPEYQAPPPAPETEQGELNGIPPRDPELGW
jgi:phage recombination protein Bet